MKTFVISLERVKQRREYIINHANQNLLDYELINAIDGSLLTQEFLEQNCDMEQVNKLKWWLSNGAIACALSHKLAYQRIIQQKLKCAFIIEDDISLPSHVNSLLNELEDKIQPNEVILLYYTSFKSGLLSTVGKIELKTGMLLYPMQIEQPITAAAYVIGNEAAEHIIKINSPIQTAADAWAHFYKNEGFSSFRLLYPQQFHIKNFKSSIDYIKPNSAFGLLTKLIDDYQTPILYQLIRYRREQRLLKMSNLFTLTHNTSPIYEKIIM